MSQSDILRINSGCINTVNDELIGQSGAPNGGPDRSHFAGQLGKIVTLDNDDLVYDSTMGVVYGGQFQYVRLAAAASAVVVGQIVFWDPAVSSAAYQVTTSEAGSTDGAMFRAGIVLNSGWLADDYSVIQILGPTYVQFRGTLTSAGAIGSRVYSAAVGTGVDNGFADVLSSANPTTFGDVSLMDGRYIGTAIQLPTNGGLKLVNLNLVNARN